VVLNARHGDTVEDLAVVVVVEIRHVERAAWRLHIDGRESGGAIVVVDEGATLSRRQNWLRSGWRESRPRSRFQILGLGDLIRVGILIAPNLASRA
jgi:hypothetical protein